MGMTALRNILLALSIGVIMWMASCSNNGCEENSSSLPLAGFYSSQTKTSIAIDSLTVYGIGSPGDSAIIRNQSSTKQVYLPHNLIDSIQVPQRRIDNTNTENIKIFFRTGEAGAQ